jgi:hypothetical protein
VNIIIVKNDNDKIVTGNCSPVTSASERIATGRIASVISANILRIPKMIAVIVKTKTW